MKKIRMILFIILLISIVSMNIFGEPLIIKGGYKLYKKIDLQKEGGFYRYETRENKIYAIVARKDKEGWSKWLAIYNLKGRLLTDKKIPSCNGIKVTEDKIFLIEGSSVDKSNYYVYKYNKDKNNLNLMNKNKNLRYIIIIISILLLLGYFLSTFFSKNKGVSKYCFPKNSKRKALKYLNLNRNKLENYKYDNQAHYNST